ncbi:MAG TPA: DUF1992 domain-containing protein [Anaerolineales bacterium]
MLGKLVEQMIQDAIDRGELDDLPGAGKPLKLDAYFETPPEVRVALSVLRNAGVPSPEIELLRQIHELEDAIGAAATQAERTNCARKIRALRLRLDLLNDQGRSRRGHHLT